MRFFNQGLLRGKCLVPLVFILFLSAHVRNSVWQNDIILWNDVINKSEAKFRPHLNLGQFYLESGRFREAIQQFNKAEKLRPDYSDVYVIRGLAYLELNETDLAIKDFTSAIDIDDNKIAYNNRGYILYRMGVSDAIQDIKRSCEDGYQIACENLILFGKTVPEQSE